MFTYCWNELCSNCRGFVGHLKQLEIIIVYFLIKGKPLPLKCYLPFFVHSDEFKRNNVEPSRETIRLSAIVAIRHRHLNATKIKLYM